MKGKGGAGRGPEHGSKERGRMRLDYLKLVEASRGNIKRKKGPLDRSNGLESGRPASNRWGGN